MTPDKIKFCNLFEEALKKYFQNEKIVVKSGAAPGKSGAAPGNSGAASGNIGEEANKIDPIVFPGCKLNIHIFLITAGRNDYHGYWVRVGSPTLAVIHYPLNSGKKVISQYYDNKTNGSKASDAIQKFLAPNVFTKRSIYDAPVSIESFIESFDILRDIFFRNFCAKP